MTRDSAPVLTRDWLLGYFGIYSSVPPVVRYSHDATHGDNATLRQLMLRDRALAGRTDDGSRHAR